ncbi:MAG: adenylate/guanylate cyclase domain-containing protein [Syntrophobacterales bacterium]|nr:adenylate/guanylate cyclase domain-containing protein [Syntrophobacterales bacterium]
MSLGVTLAVLVLALVRFPLTEFFEYKFADLKFRFRGPEAPGPEVIIVAVDDASLKRLGRWPWSREVIAGLISRIKAAGPRVVAADIIFAERQETAGLAALRRLEQGLEQAGLATPPVARLLAREVERADVDRRLAREIGAPPPTILGFFFTGVGGTRGPGAAPAPEAEALGGRYAAVRRLEGSVRLPLLAAEGVESNLPELQAQAAGSGYFNMIPDADGGVRWLPLVIAYGGDFFAPLALVACQQFRGGEPLTLTLSPGGVEEIRLGPTTLPVDRFGRLLINYLGPPGTFPVVSAADLLEGSVPPGRLADRLVLLGATAVGIYDLRVTPFSALTPGVEIQATVVDNLLRGRFLGAPPGGRLFLLGLIVTLGAAGAACLPRLGAVAGFLGAAGLALGYVAANYLAFRSWGWQMEVLYPLLEIGGVYIGVTVQRFLAAERARSQLKQAFQSYVAPAVVEEIIRHPEKLKLGGERRELSILFCDIRGFTTLAETLEPEELAAVLHDFLTPMSELIVQHGGTLDKYMGDAIMALFGAPLPQEDHALRACRAALAMVAELTRLDRTWLSRGRPSLAVGIGINTGPVAVGNLGSDRLFDYTAVGDHVNLASRLEGLNKYYGTAILVSEFTAARVKEAVVLQEVDLVRVKGKTRPLRIYEVLGSGPAAPECARFLAGYEEGLQLYRAGRFAEARAVWEALLPLDPHNRHLKRFLARVESCLRQPPGPGWDGVAEMTEK